MKKIYQLAERIKDEREKVVTDYKKELLSSDFVDGVVINMHLILKDMAEIWGVDLSKYDEGINY